MCYTGPGVIPSERPKTEGIMSEGKGWRSHDWRTWINRALIAVMITALVAGLLLSQWRVVLRYAELL